MVIRYGYDAIGSDVYVFPDIFLKNSANVVLTTSNDTGYNNIGSWMI